MYCLSCLNSIALNILRGAPKTTRSKSRSVSNAISSLLIEHCCVRCLRAYLVLSFEFLDELLVALGRVEHFGLRGIEKHLRE